MAKIISFEKYPLFTYGCLSNFNTDDYYYSTQLGQIDASFPWNKLIKYYRQKFTEKRKKQGRPRLFSIRTELALIVVKSVTGLSDKQILERLSQDWVYQRFCQISILDKYENWGILSDIREYYSEVTKIEEIQRLFAEHWEDYLSLVEGVLMDATVFKSNIKYPNEMELLWDSIQWLYERLQGLSKTIGEKMIRSKYREVERAYKRLSIQKEPRKKQILRLIKRELNLLKKFIDHFEDIIEGLGGLKVLYESELEQYLTIKKIYSQRKAKSEGKRVKGLILSLYKPYVRSIYRGKRSGRWEYGEKYHLFMLGKMVWIDHISNENYNESKRLESVIRKSESFINHMLKYSSADRIYATRSNREYLKSKGIEDNFVPVGRPIQNPEHRNQQRRLKSILNSARNSIMEGIFGVLKEHYNTERVRVKRQSVERLIIFYALMSYNSKQYSLWIEESRKKKAS